MESNMETKIKTFFGQLVLTKEKLCDEEKKMIY